MFKKQLYKLSLIFTLLLFITACGPDDGTVPTANSTPPAPQDEIQQPTNIIVPENDYAEEFDNRPPRIKINIGIMLPLSGQTSEVGQSLLNAATLALFDAKDKRLALIPADTKGTTEGAIAAINSLIDNNVDIIIGPLFSENIKVAHPIAKAANIKMIGLSNDHNVAGDGVYLLSFRPEEQVSRIIKYASSQKYSKFAALIPDTLYGGRVLSVLEPIVASEFNELVATEVYPNDASMLDEPVKKIANYDFRRKEYIDEMRFLRSLGRDDAMGQEFIQKIRNLETLGDVDFDAILLPEGGTILGTLAPLLSYYEIDLNKVKVLGTGLWHDEMLFNEPQLQGGWFAAPEDDLADKFIERYSIFFSRTPPRLVTLGYDAMALVANIVRTQKAPTFSDKIITNPNGFVGLDGIFRFHRSGLVERGLAVYEITPTAFNKIDAAPRSFMEQGKSFYVEVPIEFTPKFDPVFGLEGDAPSLSIEDIEAEIEKKKNQQNLEISKNPDEFSR